MPQDKAGTIGLDIKISEEFAAREGAKAGSVIQRSIQRSLQVGPNVFKNMFTDLARGSKQSAQEVSSISHELAILEDKLENTNALLEVHKQRLARLKEQYSLLSEMGMGESDRGLKLQKSILDTEATIVRLIRRSDETVKAILKIEDAMQQTAQASEKAIQVIDKSGTQIGGVFKGISKGATRMAGQVTYAMKRVMRRVLLFGVLYKVLRGFIRYMTSALKTNSDFARSLDIIRTNLKVAFQPIYQYILPAINSLARGLAKVTTYVAAFISKLFGKTYKDSFDAAQQLDDAREAMEGYGKAAKDAKRELLGIDEIHVLGSEPGAGEDVIPPLTMPDPEIDTAAAEERAAALVAILQPTINSLGRLWDALKPYGQTFGRGLERFWNDILVPFGKWLLEFGIPGLLDLITDALTRLSDWAAANPEVVDTMFQLILGFLAGLWVYNTTKKIVNFISNMVVAFGTWAGTLSITGACAMAAHVGVALLLGSILLLAANWSKMNGLEKTIGILGAIAIAAASAAVAVGSLQSAWTLGIAAAAIVGGVAAILAAVTSANKRAREGLEDLTSSYSLGVGTVKGVNMSGVGSNIGGGAVAGSGGMITDFQAMASGGFVTAPALAMVGENRKREVVLPLEQNTGWADILADKLIARGIGGGNEGPLQIVVNVGSSKLLDEVVSAAKRKNAKAGKTVIQLGVT